MLVLLVILAFLIEFFFIFQMVYNRHVFLFYFGKKCPFKKSFTTIKILKENLQDLGLDKEFLDMTPKAQLIKGKKSIN